MKVLHCINSPHIGGIERLVIELAIAQKRQGIDVTIMLDTIEGQYYQYLLNQDIPILKSNIKGALDINLNTFRYLKNTFKQFNIVHLHSFSPIRSFAATKSDVSTVYTIHGLSKGVRKENILKFYLRETFKKHLLNKITVFIANSNYTLNLAKKHYGLANINVRVVLNGVKMDSDGKYVMSNNKDFTVGLVSRFTPRKRIDRLVHSFKQYLDLGGKGKLVLVGDGSEYAAIKALVTKLNLGRNIELTGYKTNVQDYYQNFDICVFPSEAEPFGLVGVEAYLYGKPVLAFENSGGLKEVIEPLEPENIVKNETHLAERMLYYLNNKNLISENAEKRMAYAKNNFSVERMERDYFKTYIEILNS